MLWILTFPSLYQTIFGHFWPPSEGTAFITQVKFRALWCSTCLAESLKIEILGTKKENRRNCQIINFTTALWQGVWQYLITQVKFRALWCSTCLAESLKIEILGTKKENRKNRQIINFTTALCNLTWSLTVFNHSSQV